MWYNGCRRWTNMLKSPANMLDVCFRIYVSFCRWTSTKTILTSTWPDSATVTNFSGICSFSLCSNCFEINCLLCISSVPWHYTHTSKNTQDSTMHQGAGVAGLRQGRINRSKAGGKTTLDICWLTSCSWFVFRMKINNTGLWTWEDTQVSVRAAWKSGTQRHKEETFLVYCAADGGDPCLSPALLCLQEMPLVMSVVMVVNMYCDLYVNIHLVLPFSQTIIMNIQAIWSRFWGWKGEESETPNAARLFVLCIEVLKQKWPVGDTKGI